MKLKPMFAAFALAVTMALGGLTPAEAKGGRSGGFSSSRSFSSGRSYSGGFSSSRSRSSAPRSNSYQSGFSTNRSYSANRPSVFGGFRSGGRPSVSYSQRQATYYTNRAPRTVVANYRYGGYGYGRAHYYGGWSNYSYSPWYFHYVPFHPASFYHGPVYYGGTYYPGGFNWLGAFFNLIALILVICFIVWLIRRARRDEIRTVTTGGYRFDP